MLTTDSGYILVARGVLSPNANTSDVGPPSSGATITLLDTTVGQANFQAGPLNSWGARRIKRLIINIYTSHISAANGLVINEQNGDGNWDQLTSYTVAATTYTKNIIAVSAPHVQVTYTNSANTLTSWRFSIFADTLERAAG
ncbi:MAG: hypothetical protein JO290_10770 [Sphingomonadaceae bacterium]|nr:hypothetical protein [Sphingomonadaceae bacterium]